MLARTNYLLEEVDEYCRNQRLVFEVKGRPSILEKKIRAVINWGTIKSKVEQYQWLDV